MTHFRGFLFGVGALMLAAGCEDSPSTTSAGGSSSSASKSTSASGSTTVTGSTSTDVTVSGSTTATGSASSTGSFMMGNCTPSGSMSGDNVDCAAICAKIVAPACAGGPDQQECQDTCEGVFLAGMCPMFDNFIDCGGAMATWSCSMTDSGVKPSSCAQEWQCIEALCFGGN